MANEEFDMDQDITPREVAFALDVSVRTVHNWMNDGVLGFHKDFNGRRRVPVGELFKLAQTRGVVGQPAEMQMRERLRKDIMPKYTKVGGQSGGSYVLSSV